MPVITIRVDKKNYSRLDNIAKKTRRTKSSYIREMIELYLEDFEDGTTALERLNEKNARYLSTKEVEDELKL